MSSSNNRNVRMVNDNLEEIKSRWLKKEIKINELTHELIQYNNRAISDQCREEVICEIKNKILLDENVEISTEKIVNIALAFVPIVISFITFVLTLFETDIWIKLGYAVVIILLSIGLGLIVFPILIKHKGKYSREKTFYQAVLNIMDIEN